MSLGDRELFGAGGLLEQLRAATSLNRDPVVEKLLLFVEDRATRDNAVYACLNLLQDQKLTPDELVPSFCTIRQMWDEAYGALKPLQNMPASERLFEDEYDENRQLCGILLDLFGYLPFDEFREALRAGLSLLDPWPKLFAATSLLHHHEAVDGSEIEQIAASTETRIILWQRLRNLNLESLMSIHWSAAERLAESSLVQWATHPMEIGFAPEEIELMETFPVEGGECVLDVYLFRFREYPKPWRPGEGWMAGIAGPFHNGQELDSPWSAFDTWDSMSPEEHFEKLYYRDSSCQLTEDN